MTRDSSNKKKSYRKPVLKCYGDIRKLTKAMGSGGDNDGSGGAPNANKTML